MSKVERQQAQRPGLPGRGCRPRRRGPRIARLVSTSPRLCLHAASSSSLCILSSHKDAGHWVWGPPTPECPHRNQLYPQRPCFQTESFSEAANSRGHYSPWDSDPGQVVPGRHLTLHGLSLSIFKTGQQDSLFFGAGEAVKRECRLRALRREADAPYQNHSGRFVLSAAGG